MLGARDSAEKYTGIGIRRIVIDFDVLTTNLRLVIAS
jgi:hypothetical protein